MTSLRFYSMKSCNDDYVPVPALIADAHLEAIDAKMEALYETETITMEVTLNEPEDYDRPNFDDDDAEYCSECNQEKKILVYGWRGVNENLCVDCVNSHDMYAYDDEELYR